MTSTNASVAHQGRAQRGAKPTSIGAQTLQKPLFAGFCVHSCHASHQSAPYHPQVAEHEQCLELRSVLGQPSVGLANK